MRELLAHYRDDGPLSEAFGRAGPLRLQSLAVTWVGAVILAVGLAIDGRHATGTASLVGIAGFLLLGMVGAAARPHPRVQWLVPPVLRAGEYGIVATLAWRTGHTETWLAYALLALVAFHHYDVVYRLRHQHRAPSRTVSRLCGGWELRSIAVTLAAVGGVLAPVLTVLAVWCGVLYVSESLRGWVVLAFDETRRAHVGTEVEEEAV
jgi:hypothetical protein